MSNWLETSCYHQTLLKNTESQEYLIIYCKFCRKAGFGLHKTFRKTVIDQDTFKTSDRFQCSINCLFCHRQLIPNQEVLLLDFVHQFNKPHIDLNVISEELERDIFKPVNHIDSLVAPTDCQVSLNQTVCKK
jgi:hypothetical protein